VTQPPAPAEQNLPSAPPSDRVRLARLALDAALAQDGVASGTDGPFKLWVTLDQGQRYPGVMASVLPDGTHSVRLHLVVEPVPLHPLADKIRERVVADATAAGLEDRLGPVDVVFEDLADPDGAPSVATGEDVAGAPAARGSGASPAQGARPSKRGSGASPAQGARPSTSRRSGASPAQGGEA
jgi:hypothetical protein